MRVGAGVELDPADVTKALGGPVASYEVEPIDPQLRIHSITGGVFRVRADDGRSCVVKVVKKSSDATPDGLWGGDLDEAGRNYWKREWLAFATGLLDDLPGRLRAPRTLHATEPSDDECWIWMEDIDGRTGRGLELDDYSRIAYALGTTQGAFAAGAAQLPDHPWLSRRWLQGWVAACERFVDAARDDNGWDDPRLAPLVPLRPRIIALWDARDELIAMAEQAPMTLAHWDFWPSNLYVAGTDDVVAIDWSQVGISGLAGDLDQITLDPVWMQVRPDEPLPRLEELVVPSYVRGLHDGGCDVSTAEVERWYAASASLRYAWLGGTQPGLLADADAVAAQVRRFGRPFDAILAAKTRVVEHAVELGERALMS